MKKDSQTERKKIMKVKRILALLLVAVLSLGALTACSAGESASADELKKLSISDVYNTDEILLNERQASELTYTYQSDYTFLDDKEICDGNGNIVIYKDPTSTEAVKYVIYDVAKDKTVLTVEESKITSVDEIELKNYYIIIPTIDAQENVKYNVYSYHGDLILTSDDYVYSSTYGEFIMINESAVYELNRTTGEIKKVLDLPAIMDDNLFDEELFLLFDDTILFKSEEDDAYRYYTTDFKLISAYVIPEYVDECDVLILDNGNLLVAIYEYLDDDAVEFDVYYDDEKCNVSYLIYDYKSGDTEEIDFGPYYLDTDSILLNELLFRLNYSGSSEDVEFHDYFKNGIENIGTFYKAENKHVDTNTIYELAFDNDGKIVGQINAQVPYQNYVLNVWGNYFLAMNDFATYVLNEDGDILLEIPSNDIYFYDYGIYDYENSKLYSFNESTKSLELIKDLSEYQIKYYGDSYMLYQKYDEDGNYQYFFYTKEHGEVKVQVPTGFEITNLEITVYGEIFSFSTYSYNEELGEEALIYQYYNNAGALLFKSENKYRNAYVYSEDGVFLYTTLNDGSQAYKKVTVSAPAAQ